MHNNDDTSLTASQIEIVQMIYACGAILSLLGSGFICFTFVAFRELRTLTTLLIFLLGLSDFGLSLFDCLTWFNIYSDRFPQHVGDAICTVQGTGIQYFAICSFLWTSCIAFHAYSQLHRKKRKDVLKSYIKYYAIICHLVPAIPVALGLWLDAFGPTEGHVWCWIKAGENIIRFSFYYIPLILMWIFNLVMYIFLSRNDTLAYSFIMKEGRRRLRLYLLVLVLCKMPALINRVINATHHQIFAFVVLQAIFDSLFGFFDSMVYGIFKSRVELLRERLCCCCPRRDQNLAVHDPLIQRDYLAPSNSFYSSIAERMYARRSISNHERYPTAPPSFIGSSGSSADNSKEDLGSSSSLKETTTTT